MGTFFQDARYGLRTLLKKPLFTAVAVLTLALGIGANTAIFSIVSWLALRPLPVPHGNELVVMAFHQRHSNLQNQFSVPEYRVLRDAGAKEFSGIAGSVIGLDGFSFGGRSDRVMTSYVTGNFFSVLELQPQLGRLFTANEGEAVGADPVVVLGDRYWRTKLNADPTVIGRKVVIDGHSFTVIGIAPKKFTGTFPLIEIQAFLPLGMNTIEGTPPDFMENPTFREIAVFGRVNSGVTLDQARAALTVIGPRLAQLYPASEKDMQLTAFWEMTSRPEPDEGNSVALISVLFLGLSGMVLLLACLNVGNILLVRANARVREMAMRAALGATRSRLIRQLLTESLVLALMGGIAGIALGAVGTTLLSSINITTDLPVTLDFNIDWRVFLYAFGGALLTAVIVGVAPAVRASRQDLNTVLHQGGRAVLGGRTKLRTALVVAQVAGSLMLLIIAGLFARSLREAQRTNLGFEARNLVNFYMDPAEIGYHGAQTRDFYRNLLAQVRSMPGVESATTANTAPMGYYGGFDGLTVEGFEPAPGQPGAGSQFVITGNDYFHTLRIPLMNGRDFTPTDNETAAYVAIVNQAFADKYWPKQEPVGRRFKMNIDAKHWVTVVGVAANARYNRPSGPMRPLFYVPLEQHVDIGSLQVLEVRTRGDAAAIIPQIERTIAAVAPDLPVFDVKTMEQGLNTLNGMLFFKLGAGFAGALGALGLVLSVVGVYGVISYSTAQRTQEIGIRMALGAHPASILWMVLKQGMGMIVAGIVLGTAAALAAGTLTSKFLVVSGRDPLTYVAVSLILASVAMLACYIPARRGTRVDPMVALRWE
jgi:predicted permease